MKKIHDIIIVWAWAAGLYAGIYIPKKYSKLILEKNAKPGVKVLLSGWERANVSNMDIEPERDYFTQNKKALKSVFTRYNQWDTMSWFAENNVSIVEEDRSRLILESGDSKELLEVLTRKATENNCEIITKQDVIKVEKNPETQTFTVSTSEGQTYTSKNVIVSSWWKSFFQVGTTGEGYNFARDFGLNIIPPTRALGWLSTNKDLSEISWSSCVLEINIFDKNSAWAIYTETGPLLFTHFWVSGPIIFNAWNAIWEYISWVMQTSEQGDMNTNPSGVDAIYEDYFKNHMYIELTFDSKNTPKKVVKFFDLTTPLNKNGTQVENNVHSLQLQNWRSWKEAKATGGWIDINELDKYFEVRKHTGLFFIWEVCDVTGKTWGFNLQWAWSSAYCCAEKFSV